MAYKDIIKEALMNKKERLTNVFSEIIGETSNEGLLAMFIEDTQTNINNNFENSENTIGELNELKKLIKIYKEQAQSKSSIEWLTCMGIIERKIMQIRYYRNVNISYSTQEQRSGDNKFNYILLRSPFMDLVEGKKEIRVYFNKIEDYPGFNDIEGLKKDRKFMISTIDAIKIEMRKIMSADNEILKDIISKLNSRDFDKIDKEDERDSKIKKLELEIQMLSLENERLKSK